MASRILRSSLCLGALAGALLAFVPALAQDDTPAPIRVGVVMPKAQLGQGNTGQDVAAPVRQLIISYMSGPVLELVPLDSRIAAQVEAEARATNCAYLLYTSVEQKKGKKGIGGLMSKLAPAAGMMTGAASMDSMGSAIAVGAASQMMTQAAMQSAQQEAMDSLMQAQAGTVKKKDEVSLQYQFVTVNGSTPVLEDTLTAKAESDGQDLLSPLVEQLANIAVNTAIERRAAAVAAQ